MAFSHRGGRHPNKRTIQQRFNDYRLHVGGGHYINYKSVIWSVGLGAFAYKKGGKLIALSKKSYTAYIRYALKKRWRKPKDTYAFFDDYDDKFDPDTGPGFYPRNMRFLK